MRRRKAIDRLPASSHQREKLMYALKRTLVASITGICMAASASLMAVDAANAEDVIVAQRQANAMLVDALLAEGTPRALVLAASTARFAAEPSAQDAQWRRDLLHQAAQRAPDDTWVQWVTAINAPPADPLSEAALALQRLEPDNGAVWLFPLQAAALADDSKGVTEALARMGAARKFDDHYSASLSEWLKVFRTHPRPELAALMGENAPQQAALVMAVSYVSAMPMPGLRDQTQACKATAEPLADDRRAACLAAGRLMLNESSTLISMRIGMALLRLAGAEDIDEITRNAEYLSQEYAVLSSSAMEDPAEFARYQADWLQTGSELQAARNLLTRAGVPLLPPADWKSDPKAFMARLLRPKDA